MTNDDRTVRLLYAILSQKCLKDIDWNKVACDPVLSQEITNGHAARMRYSRFKKQMDGTAGVRKPRNPSASPRKPKSEKKTPSNKVKEEKQSIGEQKIKAEVGEAGNTRDAVEGTPEAGSQVDSQPASPTVKLEPGLASTPNGYPMTPIGSQSHTPSPGFGSSMSDMDMATSFDMPNLPNHEHGMYPSVLADPTYAYGMGMHMNIGDPITGYWDPHQNQQQQDGGRASVKDEPRWDDAYHQV